MTAESLPRDGGVKLADNAPELTAGDIQRAEELQEFLEIVAAYNDETAAEAAYSRLDSEPDESEEIAMVNPFTGSDQAAGPEREDYTVGARTRRLQAAGTSPYARAEAGADEAGATVRIQDWKSKPFALGTQLSLDTLANSPDHYSIFDIAPQPNGGRGIQAMANAYVGREQARAQSESAEDTAVWAYSHNGLDLRDFLYNVREQDSAVAERTTAVLACDSQARINAIKKSGLFKGLKVEFQLVDPQDPETFTLPANTGVALLPDTLDKLPAHQVLRGAKHKQPRELLENTSAVNDRPLIRMDRLSGQTQVVPADILRAHETADGLDARYEVLPQLFGRLGQPKRKAFRLEKADLDTREESTEAFLDSMPAPLVEYGTVFNYAEDVERIVEAATAGVRADGLVYISGPVRDTEWLHYDDLTSTEGPVVSHVLEATSIRNGVHVADPKLEVETAVTIIGDDGGAYSHVLIDRSQQPDQAQAAVTKLKRGLEAAPADSEAAKARAILDEVRAEIRESAEGQDQGPALTQKLIRAYLQLKEHDPQAGRDQALSLELARECNMSGQRTPALYNAALMFAAEAYSSAPHLSGSLIESAKAQAGLHHPHEAVGALINAYRITKDNPEIYASLRRIYDDNPDYKQQHLRKYVQAASDYLRYGRNLSNDEIITTMESISEALAQDWQQHEHDDSTFKTIYEQDLETGIISTRRLSVSDMKRIIAADAAEANAQVAGALRRFEGAKNQAILRAQEKLLNVWHKVAPKDASNQPLPRDLWHDRNQSRRTRWLYSGSLYQDDAHAGLPDTSDIHSFFSIPMTYEVEPRTATSERRGPIPDHMSLSIGRKLNQSSDPTRSVFEVIKENLSGNVLITGRSGMGKTTLMESMFEQVPDMKANFWAFDLGDKSELHTVADRLNAKGIPTIVIRPGAPDEEDRAPVSLDMFTPVEGCPIDAHIGKFVDAWVTAYGGGGDSPVAPILTASLREIYAANGWKVTPIEGETLPEVGQGAPTTPTLQELLEACVKRAAEYGKNTNAGNITVYFKRRIEALEAGAFGNFLVGENGLDWAKLNKSNVIFDFSHITSHDQRRFLFTALTMQASSYLQFNKGLSDDIDMVWAIDEASLVTKDAGEGELSRKQGVEAFAALLKVVRGYGVSVWNSTQTTEGIHPDFMSQKSVAISLSMTHARDIHELLISLGVKEGAPEYDEYFLKLASAKRGVALAWNTGMERPEFLKVTRAERPNAEEVERSRRNRPAPPIKANPYSNFTVRQHGEAIRQAQSPEQAWKQLFIGAVVLAHVAQIDLPQVPDALKEQWEAETGKGGDPEFARLLLYHITKQAVRERITSVRASYPPAELISSVVANALGLLYDEPNAQRVSPAFGLLSVREGREFKRLYAPKYGLPPAPKEFAGHLAHDLPKPVKGVRKESKRRGERKTAHSPTASATMSELQRHHASPDISGAGSSKATAQNAKRAFIGLLGNRNGTDLWKSIRTVTEGEPSLQTQRRLVAAALGYLASCFTPQESELEELLALAIDLHEPALAA